MKLVFAVPNGVKKDKEQKQTEDGHEIVTSHRLCSLRKGSFRGCGARSNLHSPERKEETRGVAELRSEQCLSDLAVLPSFLDPQVWFFFLHEGPRSILCMRKAKSSFLGLHSNRFKTYLYSCLSSLTSACSEARKFWGWKPDPDKTHVLIPTQYMHWRSTQYSQNKLESDLPLSCRKSGNKCTWKLQTSLFSLEGFSLDDN